MVLNADISSTPGAPVMVSATGTVAFVGENIKNFGKLVLVKHDGGIITAYAHLDVLSVKEGDVLSDGTVIGQVGTTGYVDTPQLHFEIRKSRPCLMSVAHFGCLHPPVSGLASAGYAGRKQSGAALPVAV